MQICNSILQRVLLYFNRHAALNPFRFDIRIVITERRYTFYRSVVGKLPLEQMMANDWVAQMVWAHQGPDAIIQANSRDMLLAFLKHLFDKMESQLLPFSEYP